MGPDRWRYAGGHCGSSTEPGPRPSIRGGHHVEGEVGMTHRGSLRTRVRKVTRQRDRGDVPGWVMVTLMTAGLVIGLWAFAGDQLQQVFGTAMQRVLNF